MKIKIYSAIQLKGYWPEITAILEGEGKVPEKIIRKKLKYERQIESASEAQKIFERYCDKVRSSPRKHYSHMRDVWQNGNVAKIEKTMQSSSYSKRGHKNRFGKNWRWRSNGHHERWGEAANRRELIAFYEIE